MGKHGLRVHHKLTERWKTEVSTFREVAGQFAIENGILASVTVFQRSYSWNYYWARKLTHPTASANTWGGSRKKKFSKKEEMVVWLVLWSTCMAKPTSRIAE